MNATITKFGYPASLLPRIHELGRPPAARCSPRSAVSCSPARKTRARSARFRQRRTRSSPLRQRSIERALRAAFDYQKLNYLALMMVDPHVHFHVIPRYSEAREFEGSTFLDAAWPKPPDLTSAPHAVAGANERAARGAPRRVARDDPGRYASSGISVGNGFLANHASRFALQRSPIACRVSRVALPTCGSSTTLSIAKQRLGNVGLVGEHVESRALDRSRLQRRDERRLVDDRAARDVDDRALLAERREHVGVDDVLRRRAARTGDDQKIRFRRERLQVRRRIDTARPAACGRCTRPSSPSPTRAPRSPCRCVPVPGCRPSCRRASS